VKRAAKNITSKKVTRRTKKKLQRMSDPIRIVPLHLPSELYRPAAGIGPRRPHNSPAAEVRCSARQKCSRFSGDRRGTV
jgi:hypothetical protein